MSGLLRAQIEGGARVALSCATEEASAGISLRDGIGYGSAAMSVKRIKQRDFL